MSWKNTWIIQDEPAETSYHRICFFYVLFLPVLYVALGLRTILILEPFEWLRIASGIVIFMMILAYCWRIRKGLLRNGIRKFDFGIFIMSMPALVNVGNLKGAFYFGSDGQLSRPWLYCATILIGAIIMILIARRQHKPLAHSKTEK